MTDSEWERFKSEIERLYIQEKWTLENVMEHMKVERGFVRSKGQYERQFKKWKLGKNQTLPRPEAWKFIGRRIEKRKRVSNKESVVLIDDEEVQPHKIQRAQYWTAYVKTSERSYISSSSESPENVMIYTPVSSPQIAVHTMQMMREPWSTSLPWLQFSRLLDQAIGQGTDHMTIGFIAMLIDIWDVGRLESLSREVLVRLRSVIPWQRLAHPRSIASVSVLAAGLSAVMPERFSDEHLMVATRFCQSNQSGWDRLVFELFLLSNNINPFPKNRGATTAELKAHDASVMSLFQLSGWNKAERFKSLLSGQEPTAQAIAEQLFASALRVHDLGMIQMMLLAGMDPNRPIDGGRQGYVTPLQYAAATSHTNGVALIKLLCAWGGNVIETPNSKGVVAYAIENGPGQQAIELLFFHGAIVSDKCLASAARHIDDVELFEKLLGACPEVNPGEFHSESSPLKCAVQTGKVNFVNRLLERGARADGISKFDEASDLLENTSLLGHAILTGNSEIIKLILEACQDINTALGVPPHLVDGCTYISPLAIAVIDENCEATELLLSAGLDIDVANASFEWTLIELAVLANNLELFQLLVKHNLSIDRPLSIALQPTSALCIAVQGDSRDIVEQLVKSKARLNDTYSTKPLTVLAAAVESGDTEIITLLQGAGAWEYGTSIRSIGNLETAKFLENCEVLRHLFDRSGANFLASALRDKDASLVSWLLDRNVPVDCVVHDDGITYPEGPLGAAIETGNLSAIDNLVGCGVQTTDLDLYGAVHAISHDDFPIDYLDSLFTRFRGAAPTAVGFAVMYKRTDILNSILKANIDPRGLPRFLEDYDWGIDDMRIESPQSVLEIIARHGCRSALRGLLQACNWESCLIGRALIIAILFRQYKLAKDLLTAEVSLNEEMNIDYTVFEFQKTWDIEETITPLQAAVKHQQTSLVQMMVDRPPTDIDINYLGSGIRTRTPLQHAVENGNMDLIDLLLAHGADVNSPPSWYGGATALQLASIQGFVGIARKLIRLGATVNAPPAEMEGRTALEGAAEYGRIDILKLLLENGASLTSEEENGQYEHALHLAEKNGHAAAAKVLRSFKDSDETRTTVDPREIFGALLLD
ncbi:hypothetical protein BJX99DRAFT_270011 [Aspergillus californicus]